MNAYLKPFYSKLGATLIKNFSSRNIGVTLFQTGDEAKAAILQRIQPGMSVGYGGSSTFSELGLLEELRKQDITLFDRYEGGITKEEKTRREKNALTSDLFLSGVNAISMDGCLHFIDAIGNRVAPILFGTDKVIIVSGINKLCQDRETAEKRMQFISCPSNAIRLERDTPCAKNGICVDCRTAGRICCYKVEIEFSLIPGRIELFLINEELGL